RYQPGAPRPDEETASRPGGFDVSRRPCKRGQGYFASHASQLTPAHATNATYRELLPCRSLCAAPYRPPLPGVVDPSMRKANRKFLTRSFRRIDWPPPSEDGRYCGLKTTKPARAAPAF